MPLSFCVYAQRCFYGISDDFFFLLSFRAGSGKWLQSAAACPMNETGSHTQRANREERMFPSGWTSSVRSEHSYFLVCGLPCSRFRFCLFFFWSFPLFTDFSLKFSSQSASVSVYLHSAPFSTIASIISVLGAKVTPGLDGKARSSLLFSAKISSPTGSILAEKPCIP